MLKIISGHTYHARRGEIKNAFRYSVDYLLHDFQKIPDTWLFSFDRFNLWGLCAHLIMAVCPSREKVLNG